LGDTAKAFINFDQVVSVVASTDTTGIAVVIIRTVDGGRYEEELESEAFAVSRAATLARASYEGRLA
jgi:hypothetical protein